MVNKRKREPVKVTVYCHPHQYPNNLEDLEHQARKLMTEAGAINITDMRYRTQQVTMVDGVMLGVEFAAQAQRT